MPISHWIPYADHEVDPLCRSVTQGEALNIRLRGDFDRFLEGRAALVAVAARHLADGRVLTLEQLLGEARKAGPDAQVAAAQLET